MPERAVAAAPEIRTSPQNAVPSCVTPQRLMAFLKSRNPAIDARFEGIAEHYRKHGETWRVRWDYAFFQMAVETNFLSFKKGSGRRGDANPRQNNFAGLGTTGGGVPGDSFPDVSTGVLAQIQHLVVYSGEAIADPVGPRTRLKQEDILESMARLNRRPTFADLSRRWAADRHYGAAIEWVAGSYRAAYCTGRAAESEPQPKQEIGFASAIAAAALGGPAYAQEGPRQPPVRTIWSREKQREQQTKRAQAHAAAQKVHAAVPPPEAEPAPVAVPEPLAAAPVTATSPRPPALKDLATEPLPDPQSDAATGSISVSAVAAEPAPEPALEAQPDRQQDGPPAFAFAGAMDVEALTASPAPEAVAGTARCRVLSASYGGQKTLLVRASANGEVRYTALTVLDGFERSMLDNFVKEHAPGGSSVGEFATKEAALAQARQLCPGATRAPRTAGGAAD